MNLGPQCQMCLDSPKDKSAYFRLANVQKRLRYGDPTRMQAKIIPLVHFLYWLQEGKNYGETLGKENVFAEKYDETRSFDGTAHR